MFSIRTISDSKLNPNSLMQSLKPVRANREVLKAHGYGLNNINNLPKTKHNKHASPFSLFSKSAPVSVPFKISHSSSSALTDKISSLGKRNHHKNSLQDFISSLSSKPKPRHGSHKAERNEPQIMPEPITPEQIKPAPAEIVNEPNKIAPTKDTASTTQISAQVIKVTKENNEFVTIRLKKPKDWTFQPGQYLEIKSENSKAKKPAVLAVASGTNDDYIEITGKPNSNPEHANYCLNALVGENLIINGPFGSTFPLHLVTPGSSVFLLGGGSGLTALKSLVDSMPGNVDAKLIYSTKTFKDLIYKEEIEKMKAHGHIISLTQDKIDGFAQGRITQHLNKDAIKPNSLFFLCGPKELVLQTAKLLVQMGIPKESIYGSLPVMAKDGGPVFRGDHPSMIMA